ncbi:cytochrome c biogenesis protein DipZ [Burkholderia sp. L27(2015)]|uniref:cytochrome c biogenesis protein DipZ n=1 Tax=Burkholderia sp. L27(2015) TaxID=1641858 RepID=UPI00131DA6F6|nr:cytochrome c biogenesis protein DipZ [Burkholderia sp. L27(2015)]
MLFIILAYLGGVLTILSPCILPVLPLVFSRAGLPFVRSSLPLLIGMALTFAAVASVATVGGAWVTQANQYGRWVALVLFGVFGFALLFPAFAERLMRPLVGAGSRLVDFAQHDGAQPRIVSSLILGVATGLLWAPCAGPILGLVLTGAALHGASAGTALLLLSYAAGAATSLAVALLIGGRVFAAMKRSLGAGERIRRGIGAAILFGVAAIATGFDTTALAQVSTISTAGLEEKLVDRLSPRATSAGNIANPAANSRANAPADELVAKASDPISTSTQAPLPVEGKIPSLAGAVEWLNSPPLSADSLHGKVVIVNFWTYSCINCLRTLPYVKAWAKKYQDQGLVVVGVHAPEFAFERNVANVKRATHDLNVDYPVAIDNDYAIWRAFGNQYWPAFYVVDAQGRIRYHQFGEGEYAKSEQVIQQLLREAGHPNVPSTTINAKATGTQVAPDQADMLSDETYVGYAKSEGFASPEKVLPDETRTYTAPASSSLNNWSLDGPWKIGAEQAQLAGASGKIVYRFHARDLHLVLGPAPDGKPIRFRVSIDGAAPGSSHGTDVAADGSGTIDGVRLYQLVRQTGPVRDRTFTIEFLDPGATAYAFTFG